MFRGRCPDKEKEGKLGRELDGGEGEKTEITGQGSGGLKG